MKADALLFELAKNSIIVWRAPAGQPFWVKYVGESQYVLQQQPFLEIVNFVTWPCERYIIAAAVAS